MPVLQGLAFLPTGKSIMVERANLSTVRTVPADAVEGFYDDHPYPPPVAGLDRYREAWRDPDRLRVEYHLMWPRTAYRQDLEILVAGCGTSQAAKHALRQPAARLTGIDISATSLRHTRELKRKYDLENLKVRQLPIERAHELGCQFDKVVCTGVLYHLADPDALLHPRDRAYTVPQLFDFVERNGFRFGRWYRQAQYMPQCGALSATPHAARLIQRPAREQYAAIELYRGTIVRHSFIAYQDDHQSESQLFQTSDSNRGDGDGWPTYVPIRQPRTICVQKNLPPGAAGVLINQAHTYTDLILPIDRYEKRLFDAIDGGRTTAEIVDRTTTPPGEPQRRARARTFFERLWWYDQVVFDASRDATAPETAHE